MRAAPSRVQTHPATAVSPETNKAAIPGFKEPPSGKRRVAAASQSTPESTPQTTPQSTPEPTPENATAPEPPGQEKSPPRTPGPEEVENDPLVKTVLDVFAGEIKRVHPKN